MNHTLLLVLLYNLSILTLSSITTFLPSLYSTSFSFARDSNLLAVPFLHTTPSTLCEPHLSVGTDPLSSAQKPSHPFLLANLYSFLPPTDLQKHPHPVTHSHLTFLRSRDHNRNQWEKNTYTTKTRSDSNILNHSNLRFLDANAKHDQYVSTIIQ